MHIIDPKTIDSYYEALINREPSYVGIFFVGVKTTWVFCIATCRARKPRFENVEFYTDMKDALDNGYRPCKVCKPTENAHEPPDSVQTAIGMVRENPKGKITDYQLGQKGISPVLVRRWFKKHYGMTFQTYQRMYRINNAVLELKGGKRTTDTAFDSGYESLSGFGYTFKKVIGSSPRNGAHQNIIVINRLTTPLGPMFVCATDKGICLLEFVDRRMLETEFMELQRLLNSNIIAGENKHIKQAKVEITEYFNGERTSFDVVLDTPGTEFQQQVWTALVSVPYGTTSTYQAQAEMVDNPKAVRAVAKANGFNRISIIVPCHRIIGKDCSLTGYGGGLARKQWLLDHESKYYTI